MQSTQILVDSETGTYVYMYTLQLVLHTSRMNAKPSLLHNNYKIITLVNYDTKYVINFFRYIALKESVVNL